MDNAHSTHLAIDLGAESGRVMLGRVDLGAERIKLIELHRFPTPRADILGTQRWDVLGIYREIMSGLCAAADTGERIRSVSVDSWGVDYVLLKDGHPCLTAPFVYRDGRTEAVAARVQANISQRRLVFEETGIQFLHFNTLYQLLADLEAPGGNELHAFADGLLPIADYFNYLLCGIARAERSLASTTQLYNPVQRAWSHHLLHEFGLRGGLLPPLVDGGTVLGPLAAHVGPEAGLQGMQVIAGCSHDTAAAVAGTPLTAGGAYLSSGTWSLMGVELAEPVITPTCQTLGFTNEVGFGGTIRLLKNISGLFLVQECRRDFANRAAELDYGALMDLAGQAEPLRSLIRPELAQFARSGDMPRKIATYCRQTGQPEPQMPGQFVRCIYDSLALLYADTLGQLAALTGRRPDMLHIVGGGVRAALLNQIVADACGIPVQAGPVEAASLGNIGVQAIAVGTLTGLTDLRALIARSFPSTSYSAARRAYRSAGNRFAALPT